MLCLEFILFSLGYSCAVGPPSVSFEGLRLFFAVDDIIDSWALDPHLNHLPMLAFDVSWWLTAHADVLHLTDLQTLLNRLVHVVG